MRVDHWCYALLMLGSSHLAYADDAAASDAPSMEMIEMLGDLDGGMDDFEIAMSNVKVDADTATQNESADAKPSAQEVKNVK